MPTTPRRPTGRTRGSTEPILARRLVTVAATADYLGVTVKCVRDWISEGRLTGYRVGVRMVRVDPAEVEAMIQTIPTAGRELE